MKAILLNKTYVTALLAYGIELKKSKGPTNLLEKFTHNDLVVIEQQTERMLKYPMFANMDISKPMYDDRPETTDIPMGESETLEWDVFLKEGVLSLTETYQRLQALSCVLREDTLYFFEDDDNSDSVIVNVLKALSTDGQLNELLKTQLWTSFIKNC